MNNGTKTDQKIIVMGNKKDPILIKIPGEDVTKW